MISESLLRQHALRPASSSGIDDGNFVASRKFSLHLGFELKIQVDDGDRISFDNGAILILARDHREVQHIIPLSSVICLSFP